MALTRGVAATIQVLCDGATHPVTGSIVGGAALTTAPARVGATDWYDVALSADEMDAESFGLSLVDGAGTEFGFTVVTMPQIPGAVPAGYVRVTHETLGTDGLPLGRVAPGAVITAFLKPEETTTVDAADPATSVGAWYIDLPPDGLWRLRALAADYRPDETEAQT
jgi:hypothetical protein